MTGTVLTNKTTTVDLADYPSGNPFTVEAGTSILTNSGVAIYGAKSEAWTLSNSGEISGFAGGVTFAHGGDITNATASATISGGNFGINMDGAVGTVINYGLVTARQYGAVGLERGGTVVNYGTLLGGTEQSGVYIDGAGHVTNSATGKIEGASGVMISLGAGTVTNAGQILGGVFTADSGVVANTGTINSNGAGSGVYVQGGGTVTNSGSTATIEGGSDGIGISTGLGSVFNSGTVEATFSLAVALTDGGSVDNDGGLMSGMGGVYISGAAGTVTNSGAIEATNPGSGVGLSLGGTITNSAGASIYGGRTGVDVGEAAGTVINLGSIEGRTVNGVQLASGGRVVNGAASDGAALIYGYSYGVKALGQTTVVNYATIRSTGVAIEFREASDRLIAESGSVFEGSIQGGGGVLELGIGTGAITLLGDAGSATGAVTAAFSGFGTYDLDRGGAWSMAGANLVSSGQTLTAASALTMSGTLTNEGSVDQTGAVTLAGSGGVTNAAGAVWTLTSNILLASGGTGAFTNAGSLNLAVTPGNDFVKTDFINTGSIYIGNGRDLEFSGPVNSFTGTITGSAGSIDFSGGATTLGPGLSIQCEGIGLDGAKTTVTLEENLTWSGLWGQAGGTFSVASGDILRLTGSDNDMFTGTLTGAGSIDFSGADQFDSLTLSAAHMSVDKDDLGIAGTITLIGVARLVSTGVGVAIGGAALTGGGILDLSGADDVVSGVSVTSTLTNVDDRIEGGGLLGDGEIALVNETGGSIVGNSTNTLTIDTGTASLTNAGLIESVGAGQVAIESALINTGRLYAVGGALTVDAPVTGAGTAEIKAGVLDIGGSFAEAVTFVSGATGTLELTDWSGFTGTVKGLSLGGADAIDLSDFTLAGAHASYSGTTASGTLTVSNGAQTATIHLVGNYTASTFDLASDGHGGTMITDPPTAPALAQAMASFAPVAGAISARDSATPSLQAATVLAPATPHHA